MAKTRPTVAEACAEFGSALNMGHYKDMEDTVLEQNIRMLADDTKMQEMLSVKGRRFISKGGAHRLANALTEWIKECRDDIQQ